MVNREGQVFYDPEADAGFLEELYAESRGRFPITVLDCHHNDTAFVDACVEALLELMDRKRRGGNGE